jgi:hypothetical protein
MAADRGVREAMYEYGILVRKSKYYHRKALSAKCHAAQRSGDGERQRLLPFSCRSGR